MQFKGVIQYFPLFGTIIALYEGKKSRLLRGGIKMKRLRPFRKRLLI